MQAPGASPASVAAAQATANAALAAAVGGASMQRTVTAPYTVADDDYALEVEGTGNVTLPVPTDGRSLRLKRALTAGLITLVPFAGQVEGAPTLALLVAGESADLIGDGGNWAVYA